MAANTSHTGISVDGNLTDGLTVTVFGWGRIRAVYQAARQTLDPNDVVLTALQRAVGEDHDQVVLPGVDNEEDAIFLAGFLGEVRNGDDPAPKRAAAVLLTAPRRMTTCPRCDGAGRIEEQRG